MARLIYFYTIITHLNIQVRTKSITHKPYKYFMCYTVMDNESKIKELEDELRAVKEHLKKYTAPSRNKKYYENNRNFVNERSRIYKETTNYKSTPEQRKEYNRRSYLKRKEKLLHPWKFKTPFFTTKKINKCVMANRTP